jgi:hypothetical protein
MINLYYRITAGGRVISIVKEIFSWAAVMPFYRLTIARISIQALPGQFTFLAFVSFGYGYPAIHSGVANCSFYSPYCKQKPNLSV